jgi:hypothetical protein
MTPSSVVFLVDVDNTLLDDDRIQNGLKHRDILAECLTVGRIGDLLDYDLSALLAGQESVQISQEITR